MLFTVLYHDDSQGDRVNSSENRFIYKLTRRCQSLLILLDDGTGVPAEVSNGFHNVGNEPAGSTVPFDPPLLPDPPTDPSSDHSEVDSRDELVTASFSILASELQRMPRPWLLAAALVAVATEAAASVIGCWEPHGRPGTNSLISSTDVADFPALQQTNMTVVINYTL